METVYFKKLSEAAQVPTRGSSGAAGYDLYCSEDITIPGGWSLLVKTDIAVEMPAHLYGEIKPRSRLAKKAINVLGGVIDSDYRGPLGVILHNTVEGGPPLVISKGDRIAQIIFQSYFCVRFTEAELSQTERGGGGFGSTGK